MTLTMASSLRCLRATLGKYNVTYTTLDECMRGAVFIKDFPDYDLRMICRGHAIRKSYRIGAAGARSSSRVRIAVAARLTCIIDRVNNQYYYSDVTLVKLNDGMPVDIPMSDPVMRITAYAHDDVLKKYLAMRRLKLV